MGGTFTLWLLLASPLIARSVIRQIPPIANLAAVNGRVTFAVGLSGLVGLYAGALGALPTGSRLPLMLAGGIAAGWSMLWMPQPRSGSDGDDWRRWPPPDDGPKGPRGDEGPDWALFDRIRAEWEQDLAGKR